MFTSAGTKTYSFVDGDCTESSAAYLLAISEKVKIKLKKECKCWISFDKKFIKSHMTPTCSPIENHSET